MEEKEKEKEKERQLEEYNLRTGYAKGDCLDCIYANFRDKNDKNEVYCEMYGRYELPTNRNGCFHLKEIKYTIF